MSLTVNSSSVSQLGSRLRVDLLILQAHATLKAVAGDPLVSKALGASFIAKMKENVERLEIRFKDRVFAEDRSKDGTLMQNVAVQEAQVWRREFTELVKSALRYGADVPRDGGRMGRVFAPGRLAVDVERLVEYGQSFGPKLAAVDVVIPPDLLKRGSEVAAALRQADATQEHLRHTERGEALLAMRRQAVAVLNAIRDVNGKARALYRRDLKKAQAFNMRLLQRRGAAPGSPPDTPPLSVEIPKAGKEAASA